MNCRNCGAEIRPGFTQCAYCGAAAESVLAHPPSRSSTPSPPPFAPGSPQPAAQGKSKIAAGLLAIFLGALGIHNFYLGFNGKGIAQLLISVLSCGYLAIFAWIWAVIEAVMIFTGAISRDARGVPLGD